MLNFQNKSTAGCYADGIVIKGFIISLTRYSFQLYFENAVGEYIYIHSDRKSVV